MAGSGTVLSLAPTLLPTPFFLQTTIANCQTSIPKAGLCLVTRARRSSHRLGRDFVLSIQLLCRYSCRTGRYGGLLDGDVGYLSGLVKNTRKFGEVGVNSLLLLQFTTDHEIWYPLNRSINRSGLFLCHIGRRFLAGGDGELVMGASTAPIPISENCMFIIVDRITRNDQYNKGSGRKGREVLGFVGFKRAHIVRCSRVCE